MSEFLSAIKRNGKSGDDKWYFLTHDLINNTPGGDIIQKRFPGEGELIGHSAIRAYFQLRDAEGKDVEFLDFTSLKSLSNTGEPFPSVIIDAIKAGQMRGMGAPPGLLRDDVYTKWNSEIAAVYYKWRPEIDAVDAKWRPEIDAVDAKWQAELNAVYVKFWDLFAIRANRNQIWV